MRKILRLLTANCIAAVATSCTSAPPPRVSIPPVSAIPVSAYPIIRYAVVTGGGDLIAYARATGIMNQQMITSGPFNYSEVEKVGAYAIATGYASVRQIPRCDQANVRSDICFKSEVVAQGPGYYMSTSGGVYTQVYVKAIDATFSGAVDSATRKASTGSARVENGSLKANYLLVIEYVGSERWP